MRHDTMAPEESFSVNLNMETPPPKQPVLWSSIIRIIATLLIFVFHFEALHSIPHFLDLDKLGIALFLLISGYFAYQGQGSAGRWLVRRFKKILVPYWLVIIFPLAMNRIIEYKQTSLVKDLLVFLGGSMFLDGPVYVISWFVTLILILYCCVSVLNSLPKPFLKGIFIAGLFLAFYLWDPVHQAYLPAFLAGYLIRWLEETRSKVKFGTRKNYVWFNKVLFKIQNHCYSFFLLHGGVLWFAAKMMELTEFSSLMFGFWITAFLSFYHKNLSDMIIEKLP